MATDLRSLGEFEGRPVLEVHLQNELGVHVYIMNYGAIVRDWQVPVKAEPRSVVLGFKQFEHYLDDDAHIGAIVGRVANRIGGAQFQLNNRMISLPANAGADHLHGGPQGLSRRLWNITPLDATSVRLTYRSPDGEMGYPGTVDIEAVYRLEDYSLTLEMTARVSEVTPVSLVQHHYFNLMGQGSIADHHLRLTASRYTPLSENLITTGEIATVEGTSFDFRKGKNFRDEKGQPTSYDINFVFNSPRSLQDPVAQLTAPDRSLQLTLWSDRPGVQLYNSHYMNSKHPGLGHQRYERHAGVCLEDQMLPNAVNWSAFPSVLVTPQKPYTHACRIEIKPPGSAS